MNSEGKDTKEPCFTQNNYQSDDQIVIALDFGTTFSGIAYAYAIKDKPEIVTILDWPGIFHLLSHPDPSRFSFSLLSITITICRLSFSTMSNDLPKL